MPCMEEAWPSQGRGFLLTSSHSRVGPRLAWRKPGPLSEEKVSFLLPLAVGWDHALHGGSLALSGKRRFPSYFLSQ